MHGYQHTTVSLTATSITCGALILAGYAETALALGAGLAFGTLLVTPDLDLQRNDARRRWGKMRFIWAPYAALSRHRGMSHTYLVGPTIRLAYLALWAAPLVWGAQHLQITPTLPSWNHMTIAVIGYFLAQWLHLLCDGIMPLDRSHHTRR